MNHWQDKVTLVTGGSAGLGLAIARCFGEHGAKIVIAARNEEKLTAAVEQITSAGGVAMAVAADVTRQEDVDALVQRTIEQYGRLDVLVNCAGASVRGDVLKTTPEQFAELIELNFLSAVRCTNAAVEHLVSTKGQLINIGSLASKSVSRYLGAYPPSKFAVAAYSQQLRLELEPQGVGVLLVCPGPIRRDDAGSRYDAQADDLPESARKPGGGVKLKGIDPDHLAERILRAAQRRKKELVVPGKARLLFALSQLWPSLGDWIVRKYS